MLIMGLCTPENQLKLLKTFDHRELGKARQIQILHTVPKGLRTLIRGASHRRKDKF